MKEVKYPIWDEVQIENQQQLYAPGTAPDEVSLKHLEVGMAVKARVMGAGIKMRFSKIIPPGSVEAVIFEIGNKDDSIGGLNIGDTVFVEICDIKFRKENGGTIFSSLFFSVFCAVTQMVEFFNFNNMYDFYYL